MRINAPQPTHSLEVVETSSLPGLRIMSPFNNVNYFAMDVSASDGRLYLQFEQSVIGSFNPASGAYLSLSDARLKTGIEPLPSQLGSLLNLRPVAYEMRANNPRGRSTFGFIAQEVLAVMPEAVRITKEPAAVRDVAHLHTVNYAAIGVAAVRGVQEQQVRIESAAQRIEALEARLDELQQQLQPRK